VIICDGSTVPTYTKNYTTIENSLITFPSGGQFLDMEAEEKGREAVSSKAAKFSCDGLTNPLTL
jgi:hypothetical protein